MEPSRDASKKEWRPSEARKARLSALPAGQTNRRIATYRRFHRTLWILLLVFGIYVFYKLWRNPSSREFHTPLGILAGAIVILLLTAVASKRLRRPKRDEKSVLHL